jgi:D-arabinose 1-dehydrogenase-like Zn-dependent alcohol dehydrogenase
MAKNVMGKTLAQGGYSTQIVVDERYVLHVQTNLI